jgi:hypothetical protein
LQTKELSPQKVTIREHILLEHLEKEVSNRTGEAFSAHREFIARRKLAKGDIVTDDTYYVVVTWPASQELMDKEWFEEECHLINDEGGLFEFGSCAFFVPESRLASIR